MSGVQGKHANGRAWSCNECSHVDEILHIEGVPWTVLVWVVAIVRGTVRGEESVIVVIRRLSLESAMHFTDLSCVSVLRTGVVSSGPGGPSDTGIGSDADISPTNNSIRHTDISVVGGRVSGDSHIPPSDISAARDGSGSVGRDPVVGCLSNICPSCVVAISDNGRSRNRGVSGGSRNCSNGGRVGEGIGLDARLSSECSLVTVAIGWGSASNVTSVVAVVDDIIDRMGGGGTGSIQARNGVTCGKRVVSLSVLDQLKTHGIEVVLRRDDLNELTSQSQEGVQGDAFARISITDDGVRFRKDSPLCLEWV